MFVGAVPPARQFLWLANSLKKTVHSGNEPYINIGGLENGENAK